MSSVTWLRSKHGMLLSVLAAGITIACASQSPLTLAEEGGQQSQGLRGILPEFVPLGLLEDDFLLLGESWASWSQSAAADVAVLYENPDLDVAGQRDALKKIQKRIRTMEKALSDRAYGSIFNPLATMNGRLSRRAALATAILDTLEMDPATTHRDKVAAAGANVAESVEALDKYLSKIKNGRAWLKYIRADELRKAADGSASTGLVTAVHAKLSNVDDMDNEAQREFIQRARFVDVQESLGTYIKLASHSVPKADKSALRAALTDLVGALEQYEETRSAASAKESRSAYSKVRQLAADGGDLIADVLASHYFNYNLRVVASEAFMNKVVGYQHKDSGIVDDFILGAKVDGHQWTTGNVGIDLKPNNRVVHFDMTFDGYTQTSTQGVTDQATIFTSGYHTFAAKKSVTFDGDRFETSPATVAINANNTTTGARTTVSGLPIFGGIADGIAVNAAIERKARSEAISRTKLRNRLLPEFNQDVEAEFGSMTAKLEDEVIPKLKENGLFPSARTYRSTDDSMWIGTRTMDDGELGGDEPSFDSHVANSLAIHLHETLLNNSLAKLPIAGESLTEEELGGRIEEALQSLLGEDFSFSKDEEEAADGDTEEADKTQFVFPDQDAMLIKAQDGELVLVLRMGLQPDGGDAIPTQEITVPLIFSIEGSDIVIEAGSVAVAPVEPVSQLVQIPRAGIVKAKIQKALPTRKVDRMITLDRKAGGPVNLEIAEIRPNAGWLTIVIK